MTNVNETPDSTEVPLVTDVIHDSALILEEDTATAEELHNAAENLEEAKKIKKAERATSQE